LFNEHGNSLERACDVLGITHEEFIGTKERGQGEVTILQLWVCRLVCLIWDSRWFKIQRGYQVVSRDAARCHVVGVSLIVALRYVELEGGCWNLFVNLFCPISTSGLGFHLFSIVHG